MLNIHRDHPTIVLKSHIQEVSKSFLAQHGFNYFQYLRCYKDGSMGLLTNMTGLFEYISQLKSRIPVVYSSYTQEHEALHSYSFLWDEALPEFPVNLGRTAFQLHHGFTYVRRSKDYYDMIAFALPEERQNIGSFYLTKFKAIEQFIHQFDRDNQDLIQIMNKNPIALPMPYRDQNYQQMCLSKQRFPVPGAHGMVYITAQELACLRLLHHGATYKESAAILQISPRSVETYISRFKQRSGFTSRQDLEDVLSLCP